MGTRSYIGRRYDDGSIRAVYCHWDGYPSNNGRILTESWTDPEALECLLDLGDLSSLGSTLGSKHDFMGGPKGECTFYGRDRGEELKAARTYGSEEDFQRGAESAWAEYAYLLDSGAWRCWSLGGTPEEIDIAEAIRKNL